MIYIAADTHSNKIEFTSGKEDLFILCGDWERGEIKTNAKKILIRGNNDIFSTDGWDFVCDGLLIGKYWFTHFPAERLPKGAEFNICGHTHLHNMNDCGFEQKWFHRVIPPNTILDLDRFMFEENDKRKQEQKWE